MKNHLGQSPGGIGSRSTSSFCCVPKSHYVPFLCFIATELQSKLKYHDNSLIEPQIHLHILSFRYITATMLWFYWKLELHIMSFVGYILGGGELSHGTLCCRVKSNQINQYSTSLQLRLHTYRVSVKHILHILQLKGWIFTEISWPWNILGGQKE